MLGTVILFARAPRLGAGKTRLARDIGRVEAWRFQRENLHAKLRELPRGPWIFRVAVADSRDQAHPAFDGVATQGQAPGDLGARMRTALAEAPPGPTIIVGSDIPGIGAGHLRAAFRALGRADAVFGPAPDGGFWLVGLARRRPVPAGFMRDVRWSSEHALADTLRTLPQGATVAMLEVLEDVDDGESYAAYRGRRGTRDYTPPPSFPRRREPRAASTVGAPSPGSPPSRG